jgi:DNA-binding transcriptional LysR family regulator
MEKFTLQELLCLDAVISEGGFQAAADKLNRTHSAVFAAVTKLEKQVALKLLDRSGYRIELTEEGRAFHRSSARVLREASGLARQALQLAGGEESELTICIGDLCPLPRTFALLGKCLRAAPTIDLHLVHESITGPWERLLDGEVDLILHHVHAADSRIEWRALFDVDIVPVAAPGFLPWPVTELTPEKMTGVAQCVLRDSSRREASRSYFVVEGARKVTTSDQPQKRAAIVAGMGWGHMPLHLVEADLVAGTLISLEGGHLKRSRQTIVAARLRQTTHGVMAARFWESLGDAR